MKLLKRRAYMLLSGILLLAILAGFLVCKKKTEAADIKDGVYSIPISLWNAAKDEASMGNKSLYQNGKLVVTGGKALLYMKFTSMVYSGMNGYLMQIDLLDDIKFNEFNYPTEYTLVPSTVISTYGTVDEFNSPSSLDINCAGKSYPKVVALSVEIGTEYTWAHVYVPVMGSLGFGDQICRIKLNFDKMEQMTEEEKATWAEFETSDVNNTKDSTGDTALDSKENSSSEDETTESDDVENNTTESNKDNDGINGEEQDGSTAGIGETGNETEQETASNDKEDNKTTETITVDKSLLNKELTKAQALLKATNEYTQASLSKLQAVVETAKKVQESETATQIMVDAQVNTLQEAEKEMVKKAAVSLDKDNLKNGKYNIYIDLWHATSDKASMGNPALNHEALLTVKDGVYTLELSTRPMTVGTITACLQTLQIKQEDGSYLYADITARNNTGGQPSIFKFTLPVKDEYIEVMIDPKVEVMGDDPLPARLKISWDTLTAVEETAVIKEDTKEVATGLKSGSVDITDETTGIRVKAEENVLEDGVQLKAEKIEAGEEYEKARDLLEEVGDKFLLYDITLLLEDEKVQPSGMVKVYLPLPENTETEKIALYRIEEGQKILITGKEGSGYYIFETNHFSLYALTLQEEGSNLEDGITASGENSLEGKGEVAEELENSLAAQDLQVSGNLINDSDLGNSIYSLASLPAAMQYNVTLIFLGISVLCSAVITFLVAFLIIKGANENGSTEDYYGNRKK